MDTVKISRDFYRLIPSRFPPVSVYAGLVPDQDIDRLIEVENATNPRLISQMRLREVYSDPASPQLQNWNLAPFKYVNPEGTKFFRPSRAALELADTIQTALAISVQKRATFLSRTNELAAGLDMRMLKTPVSGEFVDLRHVSTETDRDARWEKGDQIPESSSGILFTPMERPSATCVAILRGDVLGRSIQSSHYRYTWNGSEIDSIYAFDNDGGEIDPRELGQPTSALVA